jgi:hypothetical protein
MSDYIYIGDLSERHKRALVLFVEKFKKGALEHGDLRLNKQWTKDILDEAVDKSFYEIFELLNLLDSEE